MKNQRAKNKFDGKGSWVERKLGDEDW